MSGPLTAALSARIRREQALALAARLGRDVVVTKSEPKPEPPPPALPKCEKPPTARVGLDEAIDALEKIVTPDNADPDAVAEERPVQFVEIMRAVAAEWDVTQVAMKSARRDRTVVRPRQAVMWLAKTLTIRSLPSIGAKLGGRDHTTVIHGIRMAEQLRHTDEEFHRRLKAAWFNLTTEPMPEGAAVELEAH